MQAPIPYLTQVLVEWLWRMFPYFVWGTIGFPLAVAISFLLGRYVFGGEGAFISLLLLILAEMWVYDRYRLWAYERYRQWRASKLRIP